MGIGVYRDRKNDVCSLFFIYLDHKMSSILFLDFDGVLNSGSNYRKLQMSGLPTKDEFGTLFDAEAVNCLRKIVDARRTIIVVISSWRYIYDLDTLREMWRQRDLPGILYGITPCDILLSSDDRCVKGVEIKEWFERQGLDETKYSFVILDDEDEFLREQQCHFIRINPEVGITENDAERAIQVLYKGGL